jgi:hypothetical protein
MHDIKIEANIGAIQLYPIMDDKIDKDFDNDIDIIPSISFPDLNYIQLLVVSEPLEDNIDNKILTLKVITNEGDVQIEEPVSFYFAKSQESNLSFDVEKDAYSFKNLSWLTLNEIKSELSKYGIIGVATIIYKEAKNWAGRCFGMAGTEGLYFIKPDEIPYPSIDVFKLDSSDAIVTDRITEFHLSQNLMTINSTLDDPVMKNEFFILKSNLEQNLPVMIGMEAFNTLNQPIGRHAVLVTNMIVFEERDQITFTIIDSNYPSFALNGSYDSNNESFSYSGYSKFVSIPIETVPYKIIESIFNFYDDLWQSIVNPVGEAFKLFTLYVESVSGLKSWGSTGFSFIFTSEQGERYGIDINGTFINEITDGRMETITTSNMSSDSIYYIYLPANNNYNLEIKSFSDCIFNLEYYVPIGGDGELIIGAADSINFNEQTIASFSELDTTGKMTVDLNDDGIIDQYVPIVEIMTGEKKIQTNKQIGYINIIPNPFNIITIIQFSNPEHNNYQLNLYDRTGRVVKAIYNITDETIELNRDGLPAGLYLIELRGPEIYRGKIVVE